MLAATGLITLEFAGSATWRADDGTARQALEADGPEALFDAAAARQREPRLDVGPH